MLLNRRKDNLWLDLLENDTKQRIEENALDSQKYNISKPA